jgi:polyisoprenoid-binding protein YceI
MKKVLLATTLLGAFAFSTSAIAADKWEFDSSHATILFEYNHLGFSTTYGVFRTFTGELMLDEDDPTNSSVTAEIPLSSLDTLWEKRDNHLRSPDFFDADMDPVITFTSTSVTNVDGNTAQVNGDLSIHGTTASVTLDVVLNKMADHPMAKKPWAVSTSPQASSSCFFFSSA